MWNVIVGFNPKLYTNYILRVTKDEMESYHQAKILEKTNIDNQVS